jgi:serine/threonine protein kinase
VSRICDFGLARVFLEEGNSGMTTTSEHTGTTRYLAPELVSSEDTVYPTAASDVYALGCLGLEVSSTVTVPLNILTHVTCIQVYILAKAVCKPGQQSKGSNCKGPKGWRTARNDTATTRLAITSRMVCNLGAVDARTSSPSLGTHCGSSSAKHRFCAS